SPRDRHADRTTKGNPARPPSEGALLALLSDRRVAFELLRARHGCNLWAATTDQQFHCRPEPDCSWLAFWPHRWGISPWGGPKIWCLRTSSRRVVGTRMAHYSPRPALQAAALLAVLLTGCCVREDSMYSQYAASDQYFAGRRACIQKG